MIAEVRPGKEPQSDWRNDTGAGAALYTTAPG
jgi:hypothetical protein